MYYKYIHIIGHDEPRFSARILAYFHDSANEIDPSEHFFVTPHIDVYKGLAERYDNIVYSPGHIKTRLTRTSWDGKLINEYAPFCDFLIVHTMCAPFFLHEIDRAYYKKIAWRSWGGDAGFILSDKGIVKNAIKLVLNKLLWARVVRQFALIGIANSVDEFDLSTRLGDVKMLRMPYSPQDEDEYQLLQEIKKEMAERGPRDRVNIVIGHSGFKRDNHIEIIDALSRFKEHKELHFYFPLSYGEEPYMQQVKEHAAHKLGENVHILEDFMRFPDYARLISEMDIAIIDGMCSQALGNIQLYLNFDKKIFLNGDGMIYKTFKKYDIPAFRIEDLSGISFEELVAPVSYQGVDKRDIEYRSRRADIESWNEVFNYLDSLKAD